MDAEEIDNMNNLVEESNVRVPCMDNTDNTLGATVWRMKDGLSGRKTVGEGDKHIVLMFASAMGVPRKFYRKLAQYIVTQSRHRGRLVAIAFDWRGTFGSKFEDNTYASKVSLWHWGTFDLDSVFEYGRDQLLSDIPADRKRMLFAGHSIGGQLLSMMRHARELSGVASVASQSGYYKNWRKAVNKIDNQDQPAWSVFRPSTWMDWWYWDMALTWYVKVPLFCALFGKIPAMATPKHVALQWCAAGKKPGYIWDQFAGNAKFRHPFTAPVMWYGIEGDYYAPRAAVECIFRLYCPDPSAVIQYLPTVASIETDPLMSREERHSIPPPPKQRMIHIGGDDGRRMGHFGFQRASGDSLLMWQHLTAFLDRCIEEDTSQSEHPAFQSKL